jgi:hypothetical protein
MWLFTQIQFKIILFLLFWDVLWIINDLLAPLSVFFFMNFNKIVSFYGQYQTIPISIGSLTITKSVQLFHLRLSYNNSQVCQRFVTGQWFSPSTPVLVEVFFLKECIWSMNSAYNSFVWTPALGMEVSGSNDTLWQ